MNQAVQSIDQPGSPGVGAEPIEPAGWAFLLNLFWQRKFLLAGIVILITGFSALIAYNIPPRYSSTARLMLHPPKAPISKAGVAQMIIGSMGNTGSSVHGEIEVMRSDRLIEKIVTELGVVKDPEFNGSQGGGFSLNPARLPPVRWLLDLLRPDNPANERLSKRPVTVLDSTMRAFRDGLIIRPSGLSLMVRVEFTSRDPKKSAHYANGFARIYITDRMERRMQANVDAGTWLDTQLSELRSTMISSERAVAEFQSLRNLTDKGSPVLNDQQLSNANLQLLNAITEHSEKKLRLQQVRKMVRSPEGARSLREVRESYVIQRLLNEESKVMRHAAELETRFGERHPTMIKIRSDIARLRVRIKAEQNRILEGLRNEVRVAGARVAAMKKELGTLEGARSAVHSDKVQLLQLQRVAGANRKIYETFLSEYGASSGSGALQRNDVEVISPALAPLSPSAPRKGLIIGFGLMISLAIGTFAILLLERLDDGFRSLAQVEQFLNAIPLGMVPRPVRKQHKNLSNLIVKSRNAPYTEAVRTLSTSLMLSNLDQPPKVILIASALPGEGKTSLASSIARLAATSVLKGRAILIDCDLRRPGVSNELGLKPTKGLTDLLTGTAKLDDVLMVDSQTGLHVIPAVPGTPSPPDMLNSSQMSVLVQALSQNYDTVVLDSPAMSAVADARILARLADASIFVVEWQATPRPLALESYRQLVGTGAKVAGVVLQKVNVRRSSRYYYYYSYGYGSRS